MWLVLYMSLFIHLLQKTLAHDLLELRLVQELRRDILVLLHAVDKESLKSPQEDKAKVIHRIDQGHLAQLRIGQRIFTDGVKEQLIGWLEVCAQPLIEDVNQLRQLDLLLARHPRAHGTRAVDRLSLALPQWNPAFTDLLQPLILERDLVVELIPWPRPAGQLG